MVLCVKGKSVIAFSYEGPNHKVYPPISPDFLEAGRDSVFVRANSLLLAGEYQSSLSIFEEAFELAMSNHNEGRMAFAKFGLATVHKALFNHDMALSMFFEANQYYLKTNDTIGQFFSLSRITDSYLDLKQWNQAEKYANQAKEIVQKSNCSFCLADIENQLGLSALDQHHYSKASLHFTNSIGLYQSPETSSNIANPMNNLGLVLLEQRHLDSAQNMFAKSINIYRYNGDQKNLASTYNNMARLFSIREENDSSQYYYDLALSIGTSINSKIILEESYLGISKLYTATGDTSKAFLWFKKWQKIHEGMISDQQLMKISSLESNLRLVSLEKHLEQQNKQSLIKAKELQHQKELIAIQRWMYILIILALAGLSAIIIYTVISKAKRREKQLSLELRIAMYDSLSQQMNPHFIFNALHSLQSFILKSDRTMANQYIGRFARLIRKVLDHSQFQFVSLGDELEALEDYLALERTRLTERFDYQLNINDNTLNTVQLPALIIQPFAENAIWHGLMNLDKDSGLLTISVDKKDNNMLSIRIEDNGIGRRRSKEHQKNRSKTKQSHGTRIVHSKLQLMNELYHTNMSITTNDLNDSSKNSGTVVEIKIPIKSWTHDKNNANR